MTKFRVPSCDSEHLIVGVCHPELTEKPVRVFWAGNRLQWDVGHESEEGSRPWTLPDS